MNRKTKSTLRKTHRYLGLFLGVQFIMWTASGLYFSWTDLDEIHGDHFRQPDSSPEAFAGLSGPELPGGMMFRRIELRAIAGHPYYWVNDSLLVDARSGSVHPEISEEEARAVAASYMRDDLPVRKVTRLEAAGPHHEYRGRPLPAYEIEYEHPEAVKAYVSARDGRFQSVRHRSWRWFDFLWMTHTMDYQGRDNINNTLLRIFSLMGLVTVLSGIVLWSVSSPTLRQLKNRIRSIPG